MRVASLLLKLAIASVLNPTPEDLANLELRRAECVGVRATGRNWAYSAATAASSQTGAADGKLALPTFDVQFVTSTW